jgi:hypothetical protein
MQKIITKTIILLAVLTLALSVNYIFAAWVGPTEAPPGGNTPTPIHIGTTDQVKDAGLSLDALSVFGGGYFQGSVGVGVVTPTESLEVAGGVKVGNSTNTNAGTIRWTGTDFEGYDGTEWKSLTSEGGTTIISGDATDCNNVGGNWVEAQGVCYIPGTSCPANWTSKENYSSTSGDSCAGYPNEGNYEGEPCENAPYSCSTGSHVRENSGTESCRYNRLVRRRDCAYQPNQSCTATQTEVGCEKASTKCNNDGGDWNDAQDVCYIAGASCPSGWKSKENYSSSVPNTCQGRNDEGNICGQETDCSTGSHARENIVIESCVYQDTYYYTSCQPTFGTCNAAQTEIGCIIN